VLLKREPVLGDFDPARYRTEFVWAPARDGARVPVSLLYRRDTPRDGSAPLYQYGYGAYGASQDPTFRSSVLSLVDRGFVYAIAHVRGGQELGRRWYDDGRLMFKKNTFDDFVDVTRHLVREKLRRPEARVRDGRQRRRPADRRDRELRAHDYRALVAHVPFVDIVTTMLDESIPLTTNEYDEWGNPGESKPRPTTTCCRTRRTTRSRRRPTRRCSSRPASGTARCSTGSRPSGSRSCAR
jgi:oligopeptidase B